MSTVSDEAPHQDVPLEEATGDVEHEWHANDGSELWCTYGRPRGIVTPIIHAALGPENSGNSVLDFQFRAVLGIRTWCGQRSIPPRGAAGFERVINRFSLGDRDLKADQRYQNFIAEATATLYPDLFKAVEEQRDLGK